MLKRILIVVGVVGLVSYVAVGFLARCLVEGTEVDTPDGPRRVETLRVGDSLLTLDANGRLMETSVVAIRSGTAFRWISLSFGDGGMLDVTPTHPLAAGSGWRSAGSLRAGDMVRTVRGPAAITAVESHFAPKTVYDVSVEPGETFLAAGALVHNKSITAPEPSILGQMRQLIAAEAAYAQVSGGYYARVECLVQPGTCGMAARPPLLDPLFLRTERWGYNLELRLGPDAKSYAYLAVPVKGFFGRKNPSAVRAFCADDTQRVCFTPDGSAPAEAGGRCLPACQDLR